MNVLESVEPLTRRYDGFVLDLWGVVHDGRAAFPGAAEALARMRDAGARVVFLSNAPRRSRVVEAQLEAFGVARDLHLGAVTSGEMVWRLLAGRGAPALPGGGTAAAQAEVSGGERHAFAPPEAARRFADGLGPRVLHLGPERDLSVIEGLGVTLTSEPGEADWVLNTGPDPERGVSETTPYEPLLEACLARDLPMLCANPDRRVVVGGRSILCAGALSELYAARGGRTLELGKPDPAAYGPALAALGLPPGRVVAVGDSPHTDLAGAAAAGLDAVWALGGLAAEAGLAGADGATLAARARAEGVSPVAALRGLRW